MGNMGLYHYLQLVFRGPPCSIPFIYIYIYIQILLHIYLIIFIQALVNPPPFLPWVHKCANYQLGDLTSRPSEQAGLPGSIATYARPSGRMSLRDFPDTWWLFGLQDVLMCWINSYAFDCVVISWWGFACFFCLLDVCSVNCLIRPKFMCVCVDDVWWKKHLHLCCRVIGRSNETNSTQVFCSKW